MTKLLMILDALDGLNVERDSTVALLREAHPLAEVWVATPTQWFVEEGRPKVRAKQFSLKGTSEGWYELNQESVMEFTDFQVVGMRADPPVTGTYFHTTQMLSQVAKQGVNVVNPPSLLQAWNEKLAILPFNQWIPQTYVGANVEEIRAFINEHGRSVIKSLDSYGGRGVAVLDPMDPNHTLLIEHFTQYGQLPIMLQRYVEAVSKGDRRILFNRGKPFEYVLNRIPKAGDFRGNLGAGAKDEVLPLEKHEQEMCEALGEMFASQGLWFAGVDVIGGYLTEINITSPTGIQEIERETGLPVARSLVQSMLEMAL